MAQEDFLLLSGLNAVVNKIYDKAKNNENNELHSNQPTLIVLKLMHVSIIMPKSHWGMQATVAL